MSCASVGKASAAALVSRRRLSAKGQRNRSSGQAYDCGAFGNVVRYYGTRPDCRAVSDRDVAQHDCADIDGHVVADRRVLIRGLVADHHVLTNDEVLTYRPRADHSGITVQDEAARPQGIGM